MYYKSLNCEACGNERDEQRTDSDGDGAQLFSISIQYLVTCAKNQSLE
jgi:uncharacterized protein (DUF983 family)